LGVVASNSSIQEVEAGGLQVQDQPGLLTETLSQKNYSINPKEVEKEENWTNKKQIGK
jgi:hypothetical protein